MESFSSHSGENFGRRTALLSCVSVNFWQPEGFEKEREGVSKDSVQIFLSHSAEKFIRGKPFCAVFQEISGREKVLEKRGKEDQMF